jgi:hypothetical protein
LSFDLLLHTTTVHEPNLCIYTEKRIYQKRVSLSWLFHFSRLPQRSLRWFRKFEWEVHPRSPREGNFAKFVFVPLLHSFIIFTFIISNLAILLSHIRISILEELWNSQLRNKSIGIESLHRFIQYLSSIQKNEGYFGERYIL